MGERDQQEFVDAFYQSHGPCCAGCDWWNHINSRVGECLISAPVSGQERMSMLGISRASLPLKAGHVMTLNSHHCGGFKDEFDWLSLPPWYLRKIGFNGAATNNKGEA